MDAKISPSFWSDPDIEALTPEQKLCVLWIWTNPQMNICGFCQVSPKRFNFETGLAVGILHSTFKSLPRALTYFAEKNIIYSRNFIRHQIGSGERLMKNNIFLSVLAVFRSTVTHGPLVKALLEDYPEIKIGLEQGLGRPPKPLLTPHGGEREGEGEGVLVPVSDEGSGEKVRRSGIPFTEKEAVEWAAMENIPADYAIDVFNQCEGIGWLDGQKRLIQNWRRYLKQRYSKQQKTPQQDVATQWQISTAIEAKEERIADLRHRHATPADGDRFTWPPEKSKEKAECLRLCNEVEELKKRLANFKL